MKKVLFIVILLISFTSFSQQGNKEIGVDLNFWTSNIGGSVNISPKFGYEVADSLVIGASFRYINYRSNLDGIQGRSNIFGAGIYGHYRFLNWLYAGADIELYFTPYNYNSTPANPLYNAKVPAVLLNGGLSHKIGSHFRINAGIYYDVINNINSPLKLSYMTRNAKGVYLPIFYRVTFIFVF